MQQQLYETGNREGMIEKKELTDFCVENTGIWKEFDGASVQLLLENIFLPLTRSAVQLL
jgi:hypothetical protein